ncbi:LTA synthase family protein [Tenacibaculum caenipelagi]|uniref:Phosphoglycerol transferase MdoB-like AlkP superfamily enzyme n=1 Tax=Tenacibaculum caenipelagi TaxID=1325435 RepID=A0A4R6TBE9_9FLAO|nr:LTA synthase family protein [Tenacibaculum caenipelagi]TDQ23988.1 phosphoglycerol transferase MdoB-like AlkP superfamily enzyme [Tenacibaculum caenipelagi]
MKANLLKKSFFTYSKIIIALLVTFWLLSLTEVFLRLKASSIDEILQLVVYKLLNDFWIVLLIGVLFFPVYYLFNLLHSKYGSLVFVAFGVFLVLIELSLVKYSTITLLNLGADLLGYSYDDIYKTVASSASFSIVNYLLFLLVPLSFLTILYFFKRKMSDILPIKILLILSILIVPLKFFGTEFNEVKYQNKLGFLATDILQFKLRKLQASNYHITEENEYPLLKFTKDTKDVLGSFFNTKSQKPNIMVIILEGVGSEFVDGNSYSGFTPYLDSLITRSLYWENFVSNTGRTFGVLPSLIASLPYGETGFLEISKIPTHLSLFNLLKENGYTTSYYTGAPSSFDKIDKFLEYNDVDFIVDENKFGPSYVKTGSVDGFSWGYPDAEMFKKVLSTLKEKKQPRFDVIATLSNHEPFMFPNKAIYERKVDSILNTSQNFGVSKEEIESKKDIYATLLYSDNSLKTFMKDYEEEHDIENTIFIITGDHRLIPIEQKDKLCRFHVPLLIYSPMLKRAQRFKSVSSHWDVAPSIYSFLNNNYLLKPLKQTAWMGSGLDTVKKFRNIHQIGLMRYKGGLKDFIYDEYLYSDGSLYKINSSFETHKINDKKMLETVKDSFNSFKRMNNYVTEQDKIYPFTEMHKKQKRIKFSVEEQELIRETAEGKTFDEVFLIARAKAFEGDRETARLLCDFILNSMPNHVDARILKGRTLSWDGKYNEAEPLLLEAIERHPFYDDSYLALLDMYRWSGQESKSVITAKKAFRNKIKNPSVAFKLAMGYQKLAQKEQAFRVIDSLLEIYPENEEYIKFKKVLK